MKINVSRIRKFWLISFWLLLTWSLINIGVKASQTGISEPYVLFGHFIGQVTLMGAIYRCAYERTGVRLLVYLMTIASISVFDDLIHASHYDVIGMVLKAFIWFTSYRLLLANAAIGCKIKSEDKELDNQGSAQNLDYKAR